MNVDAYLDRIRYHGPRTPGAETLRRLHLAHLWSVPFENLSIHRGEPAHGPGDPGQFVRGLGAVPP